MKLPLLISFLLMLAGPCHMSAQGTTDEQLASYYFDAGDYSKALLYYDKLYAQNQNAANYDGLLKTYMELTDFKEAEKLIKRHSKKYNSNISLIDLGDVYMAAGNERDAENAYRQAIMDLPKSQGMVIRTANEFIKRNMLDMALETYKYGKKLLNDQYPFSYEIAGIYGSMGDTEKMISEYLDLIVLNDAYLQTVQNALGRSIDFQEDDDNVELLRMELLRRVQKNPESTVYSEMLTWLFLQRRDFNSAFIQIKALDKRLGENGQRLLNLATLCNNNEAFDVARKCFQYIADKGSSNPYYSYALAGVLKSRFEELRRTYPPDTASLQQLNADYSRTLDELGRNTESIGMQRQLAQLQAYYLGDLEAANITLNTALDVRGVHDEAIAEMKLELADILIARDYVWDASLLASQVDKQYKNDILGYQAKYLNARISYYTGDFEWAQAQLDVLKGSTSKLISNDAMELSLLITDNMNLDTIIDPMLQFANADLLIVQHKYAEAIVIFDSLVAKYPGHALSDEILLQRAKIAEKQNKYQKAVAIYQEVIANHYFDITADNALFRMAELYDEKLQDQEKAQEYYKQLMVDFPGSLFVVEARKRFRELRGDAPENEIREIVP